MRLGDFEISEIEALHHRNKTVSFKKLQISSKNLRFGQLLRQDDDYFLFFEVKESYENSVCLNP